MDFKPRLVNPFPCLLTDDSAGKDKGADTNVHEAIAEILRLGKSDGGRRNMKTK